jgi:succinoglycan biosynthesis transport protein ExoP
MARDVQPAMQLAQIVETALHPRPPAPGFAAPAREQARPISLPPWFIDRCRQAYLSVPFPPGGHRALGITSALHGEGKTTVALGIATALAADTGEPTLLLECDLETSSDEFFGLPSGPGLSDWLEGEQTLRILRMPPLTNTFLIPAGGTRPDAARVFYRLSQSTVVEDLQQEFPNVVVDLPPLLSIAYSSLAAKVTERILLVARYGTTSIDALEKAVFLLGHERISGIVLNGYASRTPGWLRRLL